MEHGDLADDYSEGPRALFVFDGLIADRRGTERAYSRNLRWGRWRRAADSWEIHHKMSLFLRSYIARTNQAFDVVTWQPVQMVDHLAYKMTRAGISPYRFYADQFELLQAEVAVQRTYNVVFDPDREHAHAYGLKARVMSAADFDPYV